MNKLFYLLPIILVLAVFSCKDDDGDGDGGTNGGTSELLINEYVAKGSLQMNEFGDSTDWVEIYNPNADPFTLNANEWTLADADREYTLEQTFTIPGNGHLLFWCDERDTIVNDIHTNFKLTSAGDEIVLKKNGSTVDSRYFFNASNGQSYGFYPDGTGSFDERSSATPNASNVD